MTNPNDAIGTNAGFKGHTSPNAFNDVLASLSRGVLSGWECAPKSGMTVQIGGNGSDRDVAIAEDNAGNRTSINNRSGSAVDVTLDGAPVANNRIDAIVAYVENPAQSNTSDVDFAVACGIIAVKGTVASSPVQPTDAQIRTAITADGGTGTNAYYVILATITVGTGVTTIGSGVITQGAKAIVANIDTASISNMINTAIDALSYHAGDTISYTTNNNGGYTISGYLTGTQQNLHAFIPVEKDLKNITGVVINSFKCMARCNGAYLSGLSSTDNWGDAVTKSGTITATAVPQLGGIDVNFIKTSGNWGGTNNAPVAFEVETLNITLS